MDNKLVVIGAGPMGLAAAYRAQGHGFDVDLIEASDQPGGMAAHFDFDGLSIERFYHFCATGDHHTLALLDDLGLDGAMKWVTTRMGFYLDGRLIKWGDPLSLITAPQIDPITKIRYGLQMFLATKRKDWTKLDQRSAEDWFVAWIGQRGYDKLWRPLLELKFYEHAGSISAAWIWQRINRLGRSRKSIFEEQLGYIEGGSATLVDALDAAIKARGGRIHLNAPAQKIHMQDNMVTGVELEDGRIFETGNVISTIPTPYVSRIIPDAPKSMREAYDRIENIAVICVILKLRRSVSPNFWVNISDQRFEIPGFVEFSNLRPTGDTIVYIPYYMPSTNPKFEQDDAYFVGQSFDYLRIVNPDLVDDDLLASRVGRLRHAQPVAKVGFASIIPNIQTPITGLQIADTCFYYPEDRGVSESIRLAERMVDRLQGGQID